MPSTTISETCTPLGHSVRASVESTLAADHVRTARSKGLTETAVLRRHVVRNSLNPALSMAGRPDSYTVQAAIAALHARAPNYRDTDWPQIAGLYEVLLRISPSPVVELNHAAAVSMVDGPAHALDLIEALQARGGLDGYELLPAVRADLLRRLGRCEEAREAYRAASAVTQLEPLRRFYARRLIEMDGA